MTTRQRKVHTQLGRAAVQIFAANDRMNQMLIEHLDPAAWKAKPPGKNKVRTIAAIFTHMHNVRCKWVRLTAPHLKVLRQLNRAHCTPQQARAGLAESAARCSEMLAEALGGGGGRVEKFRRAKFLARQDSRTITICGCGNQGRIQLKALSRVRRLETAFAYDRDGEQALRFSQDLTSDLRISVKPVSDLPAAVRQSDICVTCTTSTQPLLGSDDVSPGTFIAAVGADNPQKQELHPSLMARGKIVCDILEQCAVMGDLHHALDAGVVTLASVYAELGEVVAGNKPGRESKEEITIFDSTGTALQDVAAAAFLYEKAQRDGCGVRLDFAA